LLFHAARETDAQIRRIYWLVGLLWLAAAVFVSVLPIRGAAGTQFLPYGFAGMTLGLLFLLPTVRNETEERYRQWSLTIIGLVGVVLALIGFIGGNIKEEFLLPYGLLLSLLGLMYLWAFVGLNGSDSDTGYRAAWAMGLGGGAFLLLALGRSVLPWLLYLVKLKSVQPESFFVPSGLLLSLTALLYVFLAIGLCSENSFVVLTRRELASFFYSPIAYIVFVAMTIMAFVVFFFFVSRLFLGASMVEQKIALPEPILTSYVVDLIPVFVTLFIVPVFTMRLLSEENRTGTLEVLFTAPVTEAWVVLSKFAAAFAFYMLAWAPMGLYLISLRVEGGQPFEYRPLLTFFLALFCSGAAFISMGLFCSSLTRNQIIAAILGFAGMLAFFATFFLVRLLEGPRGAMPGETASGWVKIFEFTSFVHLWWNSMEGRLVLPQLVLFLSVAVLFLFVTVKVLESRRWR
jgi:ABC-2 type transport system permease protein